MCPSFRVTLEEKHSTRGRARLLFEMLEGNPVSNGWRDGGVHDALHLCLSCKGCKGDCPVNVDMATYKAEFLSHYYKGRLRPRAAYSMGLIFWWAQVASLAPGLANLFTQAPGLSNLAKLMGGISQKRRLPPFAKYTFKDWFRQRPVFNAGRPQVILWPDTFNNYFHPETAQAAVEVLEEAGYQVLLPERNLCCGRPLYDYGMLDLAGHKLRQILDALRPQITAGIPVVGLEPSCVSVFRDEMKSMLPHDVDAARLSGKVYTLSEFLMKEAEFEPPAIAGQAIIHGHCHDKSVLEFKTQEQLLKKMGLSVTAPDSGCCGMAGSFGFESGDKYDVSMKLGERSLLPAVRQASPKALLIADGFSCRTQVQQGTGKLPMHMSQVLHLALEEDRKLAYGRSRVSVPRSWEFQPPALTVDGIAADGLVASQPQWRRRAPMVIGVAGVAIGSLALTYLASRYGLAGLKSSSPLLNFTSRG
jgi:Fe-S oxidoreductase